MNQTTLPKSVFIFLCCLLFISLNSVTAQATFEDYPWLAEVVDKDDCCESKKVTAYQSGIFTYIYIEKGGVCSNDGNELYFENGTFYCLEVNGQDCLKAYGLTEENSTVLWDCRIDIEGIFLVCPGESVFLPALQEFPVPPLPPAGPNGGIPVMECQPILNGIEIKPTAASSADGLNGFTVTPTVSGVYEITSFGFCGGPGSSNSDERTLYYQVLMAEEEDCMEPGCPALDALNLGDNFCDQCINEVATYSYEGETYIVTFGDDEACSDAITTVMHCDSTVAFCYEGGFADFNQCEKFFAEAVKLETKWSKEADCKATDEPTCLPLEALNINPSFCESCMGEVAIYEYKKERYLVTIENNPQCSDGITIVTHCDSTFAFCFSGGIGGFNQCDAFFKEAVLVETIWSREIDCQKEVVIADPCTDLAGVDFGLCLAVMGVGNVNGKCQAISGCGNFIVDGVDYSKAIFANEALCQEACEMNNTTSPAIFTDFPWLSELVDPNDCKGTTVEVYDLGTYKFLHIQTTESGELYYENGSFYCTDLPNYDCRTLYNLTEDKIIETWKCDAGPTGPSSPLGNGLIRNEDTNRPTLIAYPNPTNGTLQVDLGNRNPTTQSVRVYDRYGRLIQEVNVADGSVFLDLTNEASGIYFIETQVDGVRMVEKVVKQ